VSLFLFVCMYNKKLLCVVLLCLLRCSYLFYITKHYGWIVCFTHKTEHLTNCLEKVKKLQSKTIQSSSRQWSQRMLLEVTAEEIPEEIESSGGTTLSLPSPAPKTNGAGPSSGLSASSPNAIDAANVNGLAVCGLSPL
jgi:hypothetical protein